MGLDKLVNSKQAKCVANYILRNHETISQQEFL